MIKDNTYFYSIEEVIVNRKSDEKKMKEPHQYLRLVIKHRLHKSTLVVYTKSIRADAENAFQDLLDLARKMRATY
jgi:hypothetical protein